MGNPIANGSSEPVPVEGGRGVLHRYLASRRWRRILHYAVVCALFVISFYYVGQKLVEGASEVWLSNLDIDYIRLSLSVGLTSICAILGGWEWGMLLNGLGGHMPVRQALRVHLLSIPPKYIPGFAWQLVGKVYLCKAAGVPVEATAVSMASELVIILLSGMFILLLSMPIAALPRDNPMVAFTLGLPLPIIAVIYCLLVPLVLQKTLGSGPSQQILGSEIHLSYARLLFVFVSVAFTWILFGLAFFLLSSSLYPVPLSFFPSLVFATTLSLVVSLMAFFVPLGLGVREAVLTFLLCLWLPAPVSAVVAIMARLVLAIGEMLAFLVALRL